MARLRIRLPERKSTELLRRHGVNGPPVDVEALALAEGLKVLYQALEDHVSGVLVRGDNIPSTIGVNAHHHPNRQRFTIAHELAHHILHPNMPSVIVDEHLFFFREDSASSKIDPLEVEANAFAATLLMPTKMLVPDLRGPRINAHDEIAVRRLAMRYRVSQQALTIRLMDLHLLDGLGQ